MFHRFILPLVPGWPFSKQGLKFFLFICSFVLIRKQVREHWKRVQKHMDLC